jgi:hypothetical protein
MIFNELKAEHTSNLFPIDALDALDAAVAAKDVSAETSGKRPEFGLAAQAPADGPSGDVPAQHH